MTGISRSLWLSLVSYLLIPCQFAPVVFAADTPTAAVAAQHVRNFGQVGPNVYRGGEPSEAGLNELGAMGVKLVVDLRETGSATELEKTEVEHLGIKYENVPFRAFSAPSDEQVNKVLMLLNQAYKQPVFVHCRRGKDRTGTVVACYRIQHDHWDNQKALSEAHAYGMSAAERGMRAYVLHFLPAPVTVAPPPLAPVPVHP